MSRVVVLSATALGLAMSLAVAGCSSDPETGTTDTYSLRELRGSYGVSADAEKVRVLAAVLGQGFLRVGGGDSIVIDVGGQRIATTERVDGDRVHTLGDFAPPPPAETEVVVTFARGAEKVVSRIRVAPPFNVKSPPATAKVGDWVPVEVDPKPDLTKWQTALGPSLRHRVEVRGECVQGGGQKIDGCAQNPPPGDCRQGYPFIWNSADLKLTTGGECEVDVEVQLVTNGGPFVGDGPARETFNGGGFDSVQHRSFKLKLTR